MPTWDEITPYLERETASKRMNAVNVLIGANIVGLVLAALALFLRAPSLAEAIVFDWTRSLKGLQLWQFLTYTFWHPPGAGGNQVDIIWSLLGLFFGCWILHSRGRELENDWGWPRFIFFYLVVGIYGALAHAVFQILTGSRYFGFDFLGPVLAVHLVWALKNPNARVHFFFFEMRAITSALLFIGIVVVFCLAGYHAGVTPVAALGSVVSAYAIWKIHPKLDSWLDARETRVAREKFLDDFELKREVDGILDKINRQGMGSLNARERRLLKRASKLYTEGQDRHE